jgi:hypothetical protein
MILSLFEDSEFVLKIFNMPFPSDFLSVEIEGRKVNVSVSEPDDQGDFHYSIDLPPDVEERWFYPVMVPGCFTLTFAKRCLAYVGAD